LLYGVENGASSGLGSSMAPTRGHESVLNRVNGDVASFLDHLDLEADVEYPPPRRLHASGPK